MCRWYILVALHRLFLNHSMCERSLSDIGSPRQAFVFTMSMSRGQQVGVKINDPGSVLPTVIAQHHHSMLKIIENFTEDVNCILEYFFKVTGGALQYLVQDK